VGGTKRHLLDLALGFDPGRFTQHAFLSRQRDPAGADAMIRRLSQAGIEVTVLPMVRQVSPPVDLRCRAILEAALLAWQPDIIHGHSSKGGFLARWVKSPAKRVYTPHGFAFQMHAGPVRARVYEALERWAGRRTDALIALCESEKRAAVEHGIICEDKIRVIENGVECSACEGERPEGRNLSRPVIGTVGALTEQKDTRTFIRALPLIRREFPEATVVCAGEGHLRSRLEAEARRAGVGEAVHLLGQRDDVPAILAGLDVFVLPSLWEGYPYALLEAMAASVPCAGSRIPGVTDIIEHEKTGLLFPAGDAGALAEAVARLLRSPGYAQGLARAAHARVRERNTVTSMIEKTTALYTELCEA